MIHHQTERVTLHHGDCLDVLRELPDASVDAVVTDPPYGLEFMGKEWDAPWKASGTAETSIAEGADKSHPFRDGSSRVRYGMSDMRGFQEWCTLWTTECLRVLKPGGHMLAFGGTRTWHRLACAVEDAGFEVRDSIAWMYGSGFPKSHNVAAAIERLQDERLQDERRFTAWMRTTGITSRQIDEVTETCMGGHYLTAASQPAIPTAALMDKMRPLLPDIPEWIETLIAEREQAKAESRERNANARFLQALELDNPAPEIAHPDAERWQGFGTALKPAFEPIVVARKPLIGTVAGNVLAHGTGALNVDGCRIGDGGHLKWETPRGMGGRGIYGAADDQGPSDPTESDKGRWPANVVLDEDMAAELDQQSGGSTSRVGKPRGADAGEGWGMTATGSEYDDQGGASRFFYTAKAGSDERVRLNGVAHPTVKPLSLMRWLVRLVTPPGGTVLEPFAGSGTTVAAAILEGFDVIAIEREADYLPLIMRRIEHPLPAERERVVKVATDQLDVFAALDEEAV